MKIFLVDFQVIGEFFDLFREESDLELGRPGVGGMPFERLGDSGFLLGRESHRRESAVFLLSLDRYCLPFGNQKKLLKNDYTSTVQGVIGFDKGQC